MGGDKAGASQGFAVIRLGVWALGAGRVGEKRSGWVAGEASPAGFGSWGEVGGWSRQGDGLGQSLGVPRCAGLWQAQLQVCGREWRELRLRAEAAGQAASLGGARCGCLWRCPALPTPRRLSSQPALPHRTLLTGAGPALGSTSQPLAPARFPRPTSSSCTFELRQIFLVENCGGRPFGFCQ